MEMMAWSLSNEERAQVRDAFIAIDEGRTGTITLLELKKVLQDKFHVPSEEVQSIFRALDQNHDDEIHYSDFLAAMVGARIGMHDDHLRSAFAKFDVDNSGYITRENLREVLGDAYEGETVDSLLAEADFLRDGRISYPEFVSFLKGQAIRQQRGRRRQDRGQGAGEVQRRVQAGLLWSEGQADAEVQAGLGLRRRRRQRRPRRRRRRRRHGGVPERASSSSASCGSPAGGRCPPLCFPPCSSGPLRALSPCSRSCFG
ncbi:unnamed protein product [Prorocentrum cordatum]|uniref:EF-hand domain-containing protein n=1 Tax=Prorocentrum cordatum TaxID=2364126 RepID=A0ABN9Y5T5_9DINO|nr:unnamed protein product [Polarella glacialis]